MKLLRLRNLLGLSFFVWSTLAQAQPKSPLPPVNWQWLDWKNDGFPGISLEKCRKELLQNRKPVKRVVVAVIDDGFDSTHPDLAGILWTNKKEIPGNGIDDDKNGYVDDVHGWNFTGNQRQESFEEIREFVRLRPSFEKLKDTLGVKSAAAYYYWKEIVIAKDKKMAELEGAPKTIARLLTSFEAVQNFWKNRLHSDSVLFLHIKQELPAGTDSSTIAGREFILSFKSKVATIPDSTPVNVIVQNILPLKQQVGLPLDVADSLLVSGDPAYFRRRILHDDPYIEKSKGYGNSNTYPDDTHGTECAGIIAALRNNGLGGDGINDSVEIMPLRITPMGHDCDEWDKDVAGAIRYAVDNGARIISMSFGKYYSPQKDWVRSAVTYAGKKGVLVVHAAMNDKMNTDSVPSFPQEYYSTKDHAENFINVGASTFDSSLVAGFSNYGRKTVDVFAPGTSLYMPQLGGGYDRGAGTSFACPVVAGLAALIWSYYPALSYQQIRHCIEYSATAIDLQVVCPGTQNRVPFRSLSRTGGIVNAFLAVEEAKKISH